MVEFPAEIVRDLRTRSEVWLALASGVSGWGSCPHEPDYALLADWVAEIMSARRGVPWQHPHRIEDDVDRLRHEIRALRTRIGELDPHAATIAHDHAYGPRIQELEDRIQQLDEQMDDPEVGSEELADIAIEMGQPVAEWERLTAEDHRIDRATIAALDLLDRALSASVKAAAEAAAFQKPGEKRGRTPNWAARMVAFRAAEAWRALTGEIPEVSHEKPFSTRFGKMMSAIFGALRMAGGRRPMQWLAEQIREKGANLFAR